MNPVLAGILSLVGILVSVGGSVAVTRLANRAVDRKTKTEGELGSSALALRIANRADRKANHAERRLDSYDRWRREVTDDWWPTHLNEYDRVIENDLKQLNPHAVIPERKPMPRYIAPMVDDDTNEEDDRG